MNRDHSERCARDSRRLAPGPVFALGLFLSCWVSPGTANELQDYASACDIDIGTTVSGFDCTAGTELPMTGVEGKECQKPPYLPKAGCYAGSHIGQQATPGNVGIVFLCRKKGPGRADYEFDDIAVIQTRFDTGKTCFYQKLQSKIDGRNVPAPSTGTFWMAPSVMATPDNACIQCHDNGPFLRTPYVMQAEGQIPAFASGNRNKTHYSFSGNDLVNWNGLVYRVKITGNTNCTTCHTMGANTMDKTIGTSAWLGPLSTGAVTTPHLKDAVTGGDKAHWMKPNRKDIGPSNNDIAFSQLWAACAADHAVDKCVVELWGGQVPGIRDARGIYHAGGYGPQDR